MGGERIERAALLVCLVAAAGCKSVETTALVVEVHAEGLQAGTDLDAVVATVDGNAETAFSLAPSAGDGKVAFPFRFGVVPRKSGGETATVELVGQWRGVDRIKTSASVGFVKGEVRLLVLTLAGACVDVSLSCPAAETCLGGACGSNRVDANGLPAVGPLPVDSHDAAAGGNEADGPGSVDLDAEADLAADGRPATDTPTTAAEAGPEGSCPEGQARDCTCGASGGRQTCTGGAWGSCSTTCDKAGLFGPCAKGVVLCTGGQWGACSIARGTRDTCEKGNDNDCDGKPNGNQDCRCIVGDTRSCAAGGWLGKCAAGTETCAADGWVCSVKASPDTCEKGNDNNCNGTPNDTCECSPGDPPRRCLAPGTCGQGTQSCSATGKWNPCSIAALAVDSCDRGNDDNCNGKANDPNPACDCLNGSTESSACNTCGDRRTCTAGKWGSCPACDCAPGTTEANACNACGDRRFCGVDCKLGPCPACDCVPGTTEPTACNVCGDKRTCGVDRKLGVCPACDCVPNTTEPTACNACGDKRTCVNRSWGTCPSCCPTPISDQASTGSLTYSSSPWRIIWPPADSGAEQPTSSSASGGTIFLARDTVIRRYPGYDGSFVVSMVVHVGPDFTFQMEMGQSQASWPALQIGSSGPVLGGLKYGVNNQFTSFGAWNGQGTEASAKMTLYVKMGSQEAAAIAGNAALKSGFVARPGLDPAIFSLIGSNLARYPFDQQKTAQIVGPIKGCAGLTDSQVQSLYDQAKTF